ncbi:hypothetical protein DFH09DRAFT_1081085 [Mycena vulgaris]|nr:hypothetical protein DFH09DRAFT_1081085 [Mycena vulgaris]
MCLRRKQIRWDLVSKPRCNSRFWQDSLTDQQDLGCGLIGSCFRGQTRPKSRVLSVSVLYPAGARWLSLRGQSARIQGSLRAYPGGFPWVEPVSCKVQTMCAKFRGIEFVRMLVALELYEIPREEVAGGAVGVVRGGFPWGGAQRVRFPEGYPNADSCSPNQVIVSCQVCHSLVGARGHTQSVWNPHNVWVVNEEDDSIVRKVSIVCVNNTGLHGIVEQAYQQGVIVALPGLVGVWHVGIQDLLACGTSDYFMVTLCTGNCGMVPVLDLLRATTLTYSKPLPEGFPIHKNELPGTQGPLLHLSTEGHVRCWLYRVQDGLTIKGEGGKQMYAGVGKGGKSGVAVWIMFLAHYQQNSSVG